MLLAFHVKYITNHVIEIADSLKKMRTCDMIDNKFVLQRWSPLLGGFGVL